MIIKTVIPLALKKNEHSLWNKSDYVAKAFIDDHSSHLRTVLKLLLKSIVGNDVIVACILWSLDKLTIDKIGSGFSNSVKCEAFYSKGNFLVKPGAVVVWVDIWDDIINLVEYWGCLDGMQIIILPKHKKNEILHLISNASYVYRRHSFNTLDELMKFGVYPILWTIEKV